MTIEITAAVKGIVVDYLKVNPVAAADLPNLINTVHQSLLGLSGAPTAQPAAKPTPAVPVNKSIQREYLVCLEDGLRFKSLKRHLRTKYDLTPEGYRAKWGLPVDYPMVAPAYAEARSSLAKQFGLGRKPGTEGAEGGDGSEGAQEPENTPATAAETPAAEAPTPEAPASTETFDADNDKAPAKTVDLSAFTGALPDGYASIDETFVTGDAGDMLICLIDGKQARDLGRYVRRNYGLKPDDYRKAFGLPANYPMEAARIEAFKVSQDPEAA